MVEPSHGDLPFQSHLGIQVRGGGQTRPLSARAIPSAPPATHLVGLFSQVPRRLQIPSEQNRMIDSRSRRGGGGIYIPQRSGNVRGSSWRERGQPDRRVRLGGSHTGEKRATSEHNLNVTPFKQTLLTKAAEFRPARHFLDKPKELLGVFLK